MWRPTSHLGLLWGILALFKSPKKTHMKPHSPNTLILQLLGSNIIGLIKGIVGAQQWAAQHLNPALDSLSVGPKGQNHQLSAYGLKVCYQWDLPYVIFSSLKRRIVNFYLSTRTRGNQPSSLSLSKLPQHHQLTMVLYLTKNHGIWYCTCGRLIGKSSMDHWAQPRDMGIGKTWWKPMTHVHFSLKRTQGVAPSPDPWRYCSLYVIETLEVWFGGGE